MSVKPYESRLIPYEKEILAWRHHRPPVSYARIAELLRQKYNLTIQRAAIFKFMKVRSGGRKVYSYEKSFASKVSPAPRPPAKPFNRGLQAPLPKFEFTPSERYNLKRLPPEEAAAIRKKLEEEGH